MEWGGRASCKKTWLFIIRQGQLILQKNPAIVPSHGIFVYLLNLVFTGIKLYSDSIPVISHDEE